MDGGGCFLDFVALFFFLPWRRALPRLGHYQNMRHPVERANVCELLGLEQIHEWARLEIRCNRCSTYLSVSSWQGRLGVYPGCLFWDVPVKHCTFDAIHKLSGSTVRV